MHVAVANLRILIGFAFLPAGLKKLLGQPFTDPHNTGPFHDFLHAFHATGWFYQFVGATQLAVAVLLMTQRFALAGAALALPVTTAITAFCWSTAVYPTASVATLLLAGTLALVLWDLPRWRGLFVATPAPPAGTPRLDARLWQRCGLAILGVYLVACAAYGGVYRPKGVRPNEPGFYVFPAILVLPLATLALDQARWRRRRAAD